MGTVKYTGPVASFHCPTNAEIRSLKVHFSPKQEGSGDPSPENVRPIVGWDGVEMYDWASANASTSSVPSEYKKVEYLESTGTQYIYTNVPGRYGIECRAKVSWTSGGDTTIFGARKATSDRIMLVHQYPANKWTLGYGASYTGLSQIDFDVVYDVEAKVYPGEQYLKINGTTIYTGTDSTEYSNNFNMSLFACTNGSSSNINLKSSARIYSLSAKLDGIETLNVVPCLRKSDNKPGMYDTVSKTFYTNAGTGEFLYGPEVNGYTTNYEFGVLGKNKLNADAEQQAPDNKNMMPTNKRIFTPNTYCVGMSWSNYYVPNNVTSHSVSNGTITVTNANVYGLGYPVRVVPGQAYFLSATTSNGRANIAYFASDGTYISGVSTNILNKSFTVPNDANIAVIIFFSSSDEATFSDIQLELGSTATAYEPYDPNKTVYGGWVDLISGEVCEEWDAITFDGTNELFNTGIYNTSRNYIGAQKNALPNAKSSDSYLTICDRAARLYNPTDTKPFFWTPVNGTYLQYIVADIREHSEITSADEALAYTNAYISENPITVVYSLNTPNTYHLAPTQLQTFLGQNNVWSNADYVEVEYDLHETQDILNRKNFIIANQPHIVRSAAAPLQNFITDVPAPLKECKVHFSPVQEGEGDPSPDNVRTISGWTGCEVYKAGDNLFDKGLSTDDYRLSTAGANYAAAGYYVSTYISVSEGQVLTKNSPTADAYHRFCTYSSKGAAGFIRRVENNTITIAAGENFVRICGEMTEKDTTMLCVGNLTTLPIDWTTEAGTVYGGYVDLVTGEVWETYHEINIIELGSYRTLSINKNNNTQVSWFLVNHLNAPEATGYIAYSRDGYCSCASFYVNNYYWDSKCQVNNSTADLVIEGELTAEEVDNWIKAHAPIQIVYPLKTPQLITTLTPTQLKTLRGTNNIWSNSNGPVEVQFWRH